jgi:hypothetical protein
VGRKWVMYETSHPWGMLLSFMVILSMQHSKATILNANNIFKVVCNKL